jgi:hypothetical protein
VRVAETVETPACWAQWLDPGATTTDHRGDVVNAGEVGLYEATFVGLDARLQRVSGPAGAWPGRSVHHGDGLTVYQLLVVDEERAGGPQPRTYERHPLLAADRLRHDAYTALGAADAATVRGWLAGPWEAVAPGLRRNLERLLTAKLEALEAEAAAITAARAEIDPVVLELRLDREKRPAVRAALHTRLDLVAEAMRSDPEHRARVFAARYPGDPGRATAQREIYESHLEQALERARRAEERKTGPRWTPADL